MPASGAPCRRRRGAGHHQDPVPTHTEGVPTPLIELPAAAAAYDARAAEYDTWYDRNAALYQAELELVDALLQPLRAVGPGLEIGAGTGRFAGPLGIDVALEPSPEMGAFARQREVQVIEGVAEELPFGRAEFGYTAFLTSPCFIPDRARALAEARRVTRPGGEIGRASCRARVWRCVVAERLK